MLAERGYLRGQQSHSMHGRTITPSNERRLRPLTRPEVNVSFNIQPNRSIKSIWSKHQQFFMSKVDIQRTFLLGNNARSVGYTTKNVTVKWEYMYMRTAKCKDSWWLACSKPLISDSRTYCYYHSCLVEDYIA